MKKSKKNAGLGQQKNTLVSGNEGDEKMFLPGRPQKLFF